MNEQTAEIPERSAAAVRVARTVAAFARSRADLLICAAAGLFLAGFGAFGTGDATAAERVTFWVGVMIAAGLIHRAVARGADRLPFRIGAPLLRTALIALLAAGPLALVAWAAANLVFDDPWDPASAASFLPRAALVAFGLAFLLHGAARGAEASTQAAPERRTLDRLPAPLRAARIEALEAEGHYVRVHTSAGSALILARLSDLADGALAPDGARVHRSWWVSRAAVRTVEREGGRLFLRLGGDVRAPVSRNAARTLRRACWLS